MSSPSLHNKTVRPGRLGNYSYYYTGAPRAATALAQKKAPAFGRKAVLVMALLVVLGMGYRLLNSAPSTVQNTRVEQVTPAANTAQPESAPAVSAAASKNYCSTNTQPKYILIDVSERHLWACEQGKTVYDAKVITGSLLHESTLTPPGDYKVYAKTTNTTLTGSDELGTWKMPVFFWMPFLDNQHGTYGFHDATWRKDSEFGGTDPATDKASHGCVELTKTDMAWLYNWADAGTPLHVQN